MPGGTFLANSRAAESCVALGAVAVPPGGDRLSARAGRVRRDHAIAAGLDQAAGLAADGSGGRRDCFPVLRAVLAQADRGRLSDPGFRHDEGVPDARGRRQRPAYRGRSARRGRRSAVHGRHPRGHGRRRGCQRGETRLDAASEGDAGKPDRGRTADRSGRARPPDKPSSPAAKPKSATYADRSRSRPSASGSPRASSRRLGSF